METMEVYKLVFGLLVVWAFIGPFAGGFLTFQLDSSIAERWRRKEWAQAVKDAKWVVVTRSAGSPDPHEVVNRDRYSSYVTPSDEVSVQLQQIAERRGKKKVLSIVTVGQLKVDDEGFEEKLQALMNKAYAMQLSLATTGVGT